MDKTQIDNAIRNIEILTQAMDVLGIDDCEEIPDKVQALMFDRDALRDELGNKSYAAGQALTEIAKMLGDSGWDYPLQVFRMVVELRNERDQLRTTLKWIADNDPKGENDPYWYAEQCGVRASNALQKENR